MASKKERYADAYALLKPLGFTHQDLKDLARHERALQRLAEELATGWPVWHNGQVIYEWNGKAAAANTAKVSSVTERVVSLVNRVSKGAVSVRTQGDPRGHAIGLVLPAEGDYRQHNNWDGITWRVNWA